MTTSELQQLVSGALNLETNDFALAVQDLDSTAATAIADANLPDQTLRLSSANLTTDSNQFPEGQPWLNDYLTYNPMVVWGTGVDLPFSDLTVTAAFYIDPATEQAAFVWQGDTTTTWKLSDSIPPFAGSVFDSLIFSTSPTPVLSLDTAASEPTVGFSGSLRVDAMTGGLSTLLSLSEVPLSGSITLQSEGASLQAIDIESTNELTYSFGGLGVVDDVAVTGGMKLGFEVGSNPAENLPQTADPYLELNANVQFVAAAQTYVIPVAVQIRNLGHRMRFMADITDLMQATIDQLSVLIGGTSLSALIPAGFQLDQYLSLNELYLDYDSDSGATAGISEVGIEITNTSPWTILTLEGTEEEMTLDQVTIEFSISTPLDTPVSSLMWSGTVNFFELGSFVNSGGNPITQISGYLENAVPVDPDDDSALAPYTTGVTAGAVAELFLGSSYGLPYLEIHDLSYSCDLSDFNYSLDIGLTTDWQLGTLPIFLEDLEMKVAYDESDGLTGRVSGTIILEDVILDLSAEYPGPDGGWQFDGESIDGSALNVIDLVTQFEYLFDIQDTVVPEFLTEMAITNLGLSFNSETLDFTFHAELDITAWDTELIFTVDIAVEKQADGSYRKSFSGRIDVAGVIFAVSFATDPSASELVAVLSDEETWETDLATLINAVYGSNSNPLPIPDITFWLKDAVFAMVVGSAAPGEKAPVKFMFGLDLGNNINLSNLPLVGKYLSPDETLELAYQFMVASESFTGAEVENLNSMIPPNTITFPATTGEDPGSIPEGFTISTTMRLGDWQQTVSLPIAVDTDTGDITVDQSSGNELERSVQEDSSGFDPLYWNLQKNFGPVYIGRVGVVYEPSTNELKFLIDASISMAGLSLSVTGLSASAPLTTSPPYTDLIPTFSLAGIGVEFAQGPLELAGALVYQETEINGVPINEYSGSLTLRFEELGLSALGAYANYQGNPSMFVYLTLGVPITIQPYLIITGVSGGFGYNRSLIVPPLDDILNFPLVSEVLGSSTPTDDPLQELMLLDDYVPVNIGSYWAAAGVRFSSFKLIDCFALLMVSLGNSFEVDLFGSATVMAPPLSGEEALAELELAIDLSYRSEDDRIAVSAALTDHSFILSRKAKLTGGAAFNAWLGGEHAGDFVLTAGGYAPGFIAPAHYPTTPRIGLNWQYDDALTIKGQLYFALLANALMAGGELELSWKSGPLAAWFNASVDLFLGWKPFSYSADAKVSVGASYTTSVLGVHKTLSYEVGADLHLFGPDFSGSLHVDLSLISFDIDFGSTTPTAVPPLDWTQFTSSFLPDQWLNALPGGGVVSQDSEGRYTITPGDFSLNVSSAVPITSVTLNQTGSNTPVENNHQTTVGVASMEVSSLAGSLQLTITGDNNLALAKEEFTIELIASRVPAAIWGTTPAVGVNDERFVEDVVNSLRLTPKNPPTPGSTYEVSNQLLSFETTIGNATVDLETNLQLQVVAADNPDQEIADTIRSETVVTARSAVLEAAGLPLRENISTELPNQLLGEPQIVNGYTTINNA